MKWEAQSAEEMGKEYYPLMGPRGGDELSLVGEPMRDVAGQVSGAAQLLEGHVKRLMKAGYLRDVFGQVSGLP